MTKRCVIIQRFDGAHYDGLCKQVFEPAIEAAGLEPYRVDQDPSASILYESIEREISSAATCFAERSEDAPNIWYEVGYSIAKEKPLCLVCSKKRTKFPFDIQHRQIITYSEQLLPTDYAELEKRITDRLTSISANNAVQQVAMALSLGSNVSDLKPHEFMALTIIFRATFIGEVTPNHLKQEMERSGFVEIAAGLAVAGLKKSNLIEAIRAADRYEEYDVFRVTPKGEAWLLDHQHKLELRHVVDTGITDEDILLY